MIKDDLTFQLTDDNWNIKCRFLKRFILFRAQNDVCFFQLCDVVPEMRIALPGFPLHPRTSLEMDDPDGTSVFPAFPLWEMEQQAV